MSSSGHSHRHFQFETRSTRSFSRTHTRTRFHITSMLGDDAGTSSWELLTQNGRQTDSKFTHCSHRPCDEAPLFFFFFGISDAVAVAQICGDIPQIL